MRVYFLSEMCHPDNVYVMRRESFPLIEIEWQHKIFQQTTNWIKQLLSTMRFEFPFSIRERTEKRKTIPTTCGHLLKKEIS